MINLTTYVVCFVFGVMAGCFMSVAMLIVILKEKHSAMDRDRSKQLETALRNLLSYAESAARTMEYEFGAAKSLGEMGRDGELPWQIVEAREALS